MLGLAAHYVSHASNLERAARSLTDLGTDGQVLKRRLAALIITSPDGIGATPVQQGIPLNGDGGLILIAGGDAKGADFSALTEPLRRHVRLLLLIGRDAGRIAEVARGAAEIVQADGMAEAVAIAHERAGSGDSVLLAPACASFDMYANYEERGDAFAAEVRRVLAA